MTNIYSETPKEELDARIVELKNELNECIIFRDGWFHAEGLQKGWWSHESLHNVQVAMLQLVQAGHWEWHLRSRYFARPIEKEKPTCQP